jgi:uncharacterized protein (DUF1330 family)
MSTYVQAAVPTIFAAGGTIVVGGQPADVLEGEWHGNPDGDSGV